MTRVLALALYGPLAASTRYRLGQYVPGLAAEGIDLQICHLLGDEYLRSRFAGKPLPLAFMLKSGAVRLFDLLQQRKYDAAMVHCELFPFVPGWIERALIRQPYIYDFDDAFYLKYRHGRFKSTASLLANKFDTVMDSAAAVTAGSRVLASYAARHNNNTYLLPTVVDTTRYKPAPRDSNDAFTIGWIGSPSTAPYLSELAGPLSILGQESAVRLVVIGGKAPSIANVSVIEVNWEEHTEVELINTFDVGVMPLPDDAWAAGKCAFKLIQYMACGVPAVASPVGANSDVITEECGILATSAEDWLAALRMLRDQPQKRAEMGNAGRERAVQHYSLHRNLEVLPEVIHTVCKSA